MSRGSHHPRDDERLLQNGLDPFARDPLQLTALSRRLYDHVEEAKEAGRVDPLMGYLYGKVRLTRERLKDVPVACAKAAPTVAMFGLRHLFQKCSWLSRLCADPRS